MNSKLFIPVVGLSLAFGGVSYASQNTPQSQDVLSAYEALKKNRANELNQFKDFHTIKAGEQLGFLPQGPSGDAILQKVNRGEALQPVSGAARSEKLKALQANTVLELQQSRDQSGKLVTDTRAVADLTGTMPSATHQQANSITNDLRANGERFKWLQRMEASLKSRRAGASTRSMAAALDRAISQVQADQVALTRATQRHITNNSSMIKRGFDNKVANLKKTNPNINLMPDSHLKTLQNKAAGLEAQLTKTTNADAVAQLNQQLTQVREDIAIQQQALQKIPR